LEGWTLDREYVENGTSAYSGAPRPAFEQMMEDAKAGMFDVLVVWASDRLYRLMSDLVRITTELAPHVRIVSIMGGEVDLSTAEGIMRAQVMGSVAEFESRRKGERQSAAIQQQLAKGRWHGMAPKGYKREGGTLVVDPVWAPRVQEVFQNILNGGSLNAAARAWDTNVTAIRRHIQSPALIGRNTADVAGDWPPLVDENDWHRMRTLLADRKRPDRHHPRSKGSTLLGGILKCEHGARLQKNVQYYRVHKTDCQCAVSILRAKADREVVEWVLDRLAQPDVRSAFEVPEKDADWALIETLKVRRSNVGTLVSEGLLDLAEARVKLTELTDEIERLTAAARPRVTIPNDAESVEAVWNVMPLSDQRAVIRTLVDIRVAASARYGRDRRLTITSR
jgi:DNA invertase Pin-like site-specific DNA recombinase